MDMEHIGHVILKYNKETQYATKIVLLKKEKQTMNKHLKTIAKILKKEKKNIPFEHWWYITGKITQALKKDNPGISFDNFEIKSGRELL